MIAYVDEAAGEPAAGRKKNLFLPFGVLAAVLAISAVLVFDEGETAIAFAIATAWIVEVAVWVYVFASAI